MSIDSAFISVPNPLDFLIGPETVMYFFVFVVLLPLIIFAVAWSQCFWTNFINCMLVLVSSVIAFDYAQPLANMVNEKTPEWAGYTEFLIMWVIFWIVFGVSKATTNYLSKFPVRFGKDLDKIMDPIGCLALAGVLYGWICFSLFASPVGDPTFVQMMKQGIPGMVGQAYGMLAVEVPSRLGMGGGTFDTVKYAQTRLQRALDEENNGKGN
ncbi:hypothetical protein GC197_18055 [bacterium]|nr:hypothetical protein [bacterium]